MARMELDKIIEKIGEVRNQMVRQNAIENPVVLSELMMMLAQLCHLLGDNLADSVLAAKQLKAQKLQEFRKEGNGKQGEIMTRFDSDVIKAEGEASKLELAVKSTNNLISASQSHIKVKLAEASQSGL